jgi:hypothetical protein
MICMDFIVIPNSVTNLQSFLIIGKGLVAQQAKPTDKENFSEYSSAYILIRACTYAPVRHLVLSHSVLPYATSSNTCRVRMFAFIINLLSTKFATQLTVVSELHG